MGVTCGFLSEVSGGSIREPPGQRIGAPLVTSPSAAAWRHSVQTMAEAIRTEGLTKRYGHTTARDALDLTVEAREVFGYLGPNGAGKSTTISLLLALIRPSSG